MDKRGVLRKSSFMLLPHNATESGPGRGPRLLFVTYASGDCFALERILKDDWSVMWSSTPGEAVVQLKQNSSPIVVCDGDTHSWRELLEQLARLPDPPLLIVTSRLVDERLWAEALNFGAWDVLVKPWDREEVNRILESAWLHSCGRRAHPESSLRPTPA